jgi:hypothetical protein
MPGLLGVVLAVGVVCRRRPRWRRLRDCRVAVDRADLGPFGRRVLLIVMVSDRSLCGCCASCWRGRCLLV